MRAKAWAKMGGELCAQLSITGSFHFLLSISQDPIKTPPPPPCLPISPSTLFSVRSCICRNYKVWSWISLSHWGERQIVEDSVVLHMVTILTFKITGRLELCAGFTTICVIPWGAKASTSTGGDSRRSWEQSSNVYVCCSTEYTIICIT